MFVQRKFNRVFDLQYLKYVFVDVQILRLLA